MKAPAFFLLFVGVALPCAAQETCYETCQDWVCDPQQWVDDSCPGGCHQECGTCQDCWETCDEWGNCWTECGEPYSCNCQDVCDPPYVCGGHYEPDSPNCYWGQPYHCNPHPCPPPPEFCGDGACNNGEDCSSCSSDCGECPPPPPVCACAGENNPYEDADGDCVAGPPFGDDCNDGDCSIGGGCAVCDNNEFCEFNETSSSCPGDCGSCGDASCGLGEDCGSCAADCGTCPPPTAEPAFVAASVSTSGQQPGSTVVLTATCSGQVIANLPGDPIHMYIELRIDDAIVASKHVYGQTQVSDAVTAQFQVDRTDRQLSCYVEEQYTGSWSESSGTVLRRRPFSIPAPLVDTFTDYGFGHYSRYRLYQVNDNYNLPYGYTDTTIDEAFVFVGTNGCELSFITKSGETLNNEGRFEDRYHTGPSPGGGAIPACAVVPSCVTYTRQIIDFDNFFSFSHAVTWRCTDVEVGPF